MIKKGLIMYKGKTTRCGTCLARRTCLSPENYMITMSREECKMPLLTMPKSDLLEVFLNGEGPIVRKVIVRDIPLPFISSGNELAELVGQRVYKVHALGSSTSITEYKVCSSPAAYRLTYGGMYVHAMFQSLTVNGRDTNYGPYKESLQDMNVLPNSYNRHAIFALAQAAWIYANYVKDYPYYDFHQEINYS